MALFGVFARPIWAIESTQEVTLQCKEETFSVEQKLFESDLLHGNRLLKEGLDPNYLAGWNILFSYLDNPYRYKYQSIDRFEQLLHSVQLSGSKRWVKALKELAATIPEADVPTAWTKLDPFRKSATVDETIALVERVQDGLVALTFASDEPTLSQALTTHGPKIRKVDLETLPSGFVPKFSGAFSALNELTLNGITLWNRLSAHLQNNQTLRRLTLKVENYPTITLESFEGCCALEYLHLENSFEATHPLFCNGVFPFKNPAKMTKLKEMCLRSVPIVQGTLASIAALQTLESLTIKHAFLSPLQEVQQLAKSRALTTLCCKHLRSFGSFKSCLNGPVVTVSFSPYDSYLKGALHNLQKKLPQLKIAPAPQLKDYTNFNEVILSQEVRSYYTTTHLYDLFTATQAKKSDLEALLRLANIEHQNWSAESGCQADSSLLNNGSPDNNYSPYDENRVLDPSPYINASLFPGPGNRNRIATQEPITVEAQAAFWQMVHKQNISLIVMVKDYGLPYFSEDLNVEKFYGGISVTYVEKKNLEVGHLRRYLVNGRPICHLVVPWVDNSGIDAVLFKKLVEFVATLEMENPGTTCVHCAMGVGRTGTFLAGLYLHYLLKKQPKNALLNLEALILGMRQQRMFLVISDTQLQCLLALFAQIQLAKDLGNSLQSLDAQKRPDSSSKTMQETVEKLTKLS